MATVPLVDYRVYAVLRKAGYLSANEAMDITCRLRAGQTVRFKGLKLKPETETRARIYHSR